MIDRLRHRPTVAPAIDRVCLLACLLLLFAAPPAIAQSMPHFGHQAWTTEDGLPQNTVHQVLQTRDGYLWIATEGGLARFDGLSFTVMRHEQQPAFPSDDIACLAEDALGTLWIGTTDGLLRYSDGRFTQILLERGAPLPSVLSLAAAEDGSLLILTTQGLLRLVDGRVVPFALAPADVETLSSGPDHSVWLIARSRIVELVGGQPADRGDLPRSGSPLGLTVNADRSLLLRSTSGLQIKPRLTAPWQPGPSLPDASMTATLRDPAGQLWIGTKRGLYLATSGSPVRVEALGDRAILSLALDREGDIWVGTEADGLHILRPQRVDSVAGLNDQAVSALAETPTGALWIGTRDDGLRVLQRQATVAVAPPLSQPLTSQLVLSLASGAHGDVWAGTLDGLNHILPTGRVDRYTSADGLPDDSIRSLLVNDDDSLWIGTRRGLVHWSGQTGSPFNRINGLPSDLIGALLRGHPSHQSGPAGGAPLWVATLSGLSRVDDTAGQPDVHSYVYPSDGAPAVITSLAEDDAGTLWVGTRSNGLAALTGNGLEQLAGDDLPHAINSLVTDTAGHLWLGTPRGIFRVAAADLRHCLTEPPLQGRSRPCDPPLARFGYADGMPTDETTGVGHPAALRAQNGTLWFATTRGVASLDPQAVHQGVAPPPTVIERFLVDNVETTNEGHGAQPLRLPFGHGSLTFDYAGLSFAAPSRVRYRYRLEGFDQQWTEAGARRSAYYTNLPPGRYTFRVQAENNDGLWNREGAHLAFSILPPFYRRAWFYLLILLLLASLIYGMYYLRVRRLRSQFDAVLGERSRIAREIHDTLAQNFVGISLQLQLAEQLLRVNDVSGTGEQLRQTKALVQEGLHDARQSIWELRATVAQDSLPTRISRAAERAAGTQWALDLSIGGIYRALDPDLEKEVLRIAQEALANVSRHAHATEVTLRLEYETEQLLLTIVDNGTGFDPRSVVAAEGHFGLQGMRERAAALTADLDITSASGGGTTVTLAVPLPRMERRET